MIQPGSDVGGIGAGLVRMVRPWDEWLVVWGYDIAGPPPVVDEAAATSIVRNLLGLPDLEVEITGTSLWGNNEMYATHLQSGRVFCVGDAVHRHPPSNGLGSNTSVQDSYNLAWKLAAVLRGYAAPSLLDSYSAERAPVAERIVRRANRSSREFVDFFVALGLTQARTEEEMVAAIESARPTPPPGPPSARPGQGHGAEELRVQRARRRARPGLRVGRRRPRRHHATRPDPRPRPVPRAVHGTRSHLPHAWVGDAMTRLATMDLAPYDRFTVLTGIAGEAWEEAAEQVAADLGVPLRAVVIGPGRVVTDLYDDWARLREVEEGGALLVRPDKHIAWRAHTLLDDPRRALRDALARVLGRDEDQQ